MVEADVEVEGAPLNQISHVVYPPQKIPNYGQPNEKIILRSILVPSL